MVALSVTQGEQLSSAIFHEGLNEKGKPVPAMYRYLLTREWKMPARKFGRRYMHFVMLNPSKADALRDDPTVTRCINFAKEYGMDGIKVVNLYAYVATKPSDLLTARKSGIDIVGPDNNTFIRNAAFEVSALNGSMIVCAWGNQNLGIDRPRQVFTILSAYVDTIYSFDTNANGSPRHPLYLPSDSDLYEWEGPE